MRLSFGMVCDVTLLEQYLCSTGPLYLSMAFNHWTFLILIHRIILWHPLIGNNLHPESVSLTCSLYLLVLHIFLTSDRWLWMALSCSIEIVLLATFLILSPSLFKLDLHWVFLLALVRHLFEDVGTLQPLSKPQRWIPTWAHLFLWVRSRYISISPQFSAKHRVESNTT